MTGNKINSREDIIKYVGFKPGTPATRDEFADPQQALAVGPLRPIARLTIYHPATIDDTASLQVNVLELLKATPLNKPLSPEEEILLKCRNWLADYSSLGRRRNLAMQSPVTTLASVVFSPTEGVFFHVACKRARQFQSQSIVRACCRLERLDSTTALDGRKGCQCRRPRQLIGSIALSLNDSANYSHEDYRVIKFGLGEQE